MSNMKRILSSMINRKTWLEAIRVKIILVIEYKFIVCIVIIRDFRQRLVKAIVIIVRRLELRLVRIMISSRILLLEPMDLVGMLESGRVLLWKSLDRVDLLECFRGDGARRKF